MHRPEPGGPKSKILGGHLGAYFPSLKANNLLSLDSICYWWQSVASIVYKNSLKTDFTPGTCKLYSLKQISAYAASSG